MSEERGPRFPWMRALGGTPRQEVEEELRHHFEERIREYEAAGMTPEEARQTALRRLGDLDRVETECTELLAAERRAEDRSALGRISWLDVRLGVRMLAKYPAMSLVSVLGMAVAVALGAGAFGSIWALMNAELPLPGGGEIVAIVTEDERAYGSPYRQVLHDFEFWRDEVSSVTDVSAFRDATHNLIAADGTTELVRVAEITASGLGVARTPPALGRPLLPSDEHPGAEPVVVIGYDEWQRRFGGDPGVLGRTLRLGGTLHTIVGVMPEGFLFPLNHRFWTPFGLDPSTWERGQGPEIHVFGRLAPTASLETARTELATIGGLTAAIYPESHEYLRPRVLPYAVAYGVDVDSPEQAFVFRSIPFAVALLLVLVAVNVAILVYARTASRAGEIAVRSALGASRGRIVGQLFVEALVPSVLAAVVGLVLSAVALEQAEAWLRRTTDRMPFWWNFGISPATAAYVAGLTVLAGVIVGVVPGLKATGRHVRGGLQQVAVGGSRMRLGRTWTTLIVAQVAVAVTILPFVVYVSGRAMSAASGSSGYVASEIVRAGLSRAPGQPSHGSDPETRAAAAEAAFRQSTTELIRRIESEQAVRGVSFATSFPGGGRFLRVEAEDGGTQQVSVTGIAPGFFDVIGAPLLAGREFEPADAGSEATSIIVDRRFANEVFGDEDVLGRRVRLLVPVSGGEPGDFEPGPWREIVGVAPEVGVQLFFEPALPKMYEPLSLDRTAGLVLAVRVPGDASHFAPQLRTVAAAIDPTLQLTGLQTAASYERSGAQAMRFIALLMLAVTAAVLLLSAAGIYAMMSFTVAKRRREIGIRVALGAGHRGVLIGVFTRAGAQVGTGVLIGLALTVLLDRALGGETFAGDAVLLLPGVALLMTAVGAVAACGPARRALSVEPKEALREE